MELSRVLVDIPWGRLPGAGDAIRAAEALEKESQKGKEWTSLVSQLLKSSPKGPWKTLLLKLKATKFPATLPKADRSIPISEAWAEVLDDIGSNVPRAQSPRKKYKPSKAVQHLLDALTELQQKKKQ